MLVQIRHPGVLKCFCICSYSSIFFFFYLKNKKEGKGQIFFLFFPAGYLPESLLSFIIGYITAQDKASCAYIGVAMRGQRDVSRSDFYNFQFVLLKGSIPPFLSLLTSCGLEYGNDGAQHTKTACTLGLAAQQKAEVWGADDFTCQCTPISLSFYVKKK